MFNTGDCMVAFARGGYEVSGNSELLLEEPYCLVYKELVPPESLEKVPFIRYQTDASVANTLKNGVPSILKNHPLWRWTSIP